MFMFWGWLQTRETFVELLELVLINLEVMYSVIDG